MRPRARTITIAVALASLLAPAAAEGAWKLKGRGFGHGVGLSQYGAYGFAKHGRNYKQILDHYFRKTKVGKTGGENVRVLLGSGGGSVGFTGADRACGRKLKPKRRYELSADGGGVVLRGKGGDRLSRCGREGKAAGGVRIGGFGRYRGALVARNNGGSLQVINRVGLEGYLKGVVPNEVPSSWPRQALRAQAVVARSYGVSTERSGPFDHYDDTRSQVYDGRASETKRTNAAVSATEREVVKHRGAVATTYYFSTSGGETENSEYGFSGGSTVPYLKAVKDPFDKASPYHRWTVKLSDREMESKLSGLFGGKLGKVDITARGKSPRVVRARVVGSRDSTSVTGDTLRARLGLRSTWVRFRHR
jgi:stage II sporulation protein D